MPVLHFEVTGQYITRTDSCKPVAKCQNYFTANFSFLTDEWEGIKTALFTMNGNSTAMVLDDDGNCTVPWEFFNVSNTSMGSVSVFCGDLVTANAACVLVYQSGYTESSASEPPTPDVYAQLTALAQEAVDTANSVREEADSGAFDGKPGETGPQGPQGEAASVMIGTVTTGESGSSAKVTNSGTSQRAVLDFVLPAGPPGKNAPQIDDTQITNSNPWSSQKMIDTLCPSFTVTGDFAVFTPVEGYALNVNAEISLDQEGTGDPSAENIRPIIGKNEINLYHGGINLADILNAQILYNNDSSKFAPQPRPDFTDGKIICGISGSNYWNHGITDELTVHSDGSISYYFRTNAYGFGYVTSVLPGRTYTFSYSSPKSFFVYALGIDENGNVSVNSGGGVGYSLTATAAETDKYLLFLIALNGSENAGLYTIQKFQITGGSVHRNYEIFHPDSSQMTTTLPKTIYGGTLDMVSGEGQETWGYIPSYNGETLPGEWISDRDVYASGTVPTTGAQVAYALSQPVSFSVDPQPITGLSGMNMIFSDTGTVTVSGKSDPESVIQQLYDRISALEENALGG